MRGKLERTYHKLMTEENTDRYLMDCNRSGKEKRAGWRLNEAAQGKNKST